MDNAYWTGEVGKLLGVSKDTVRAWALRLEAVGYEFPRDPQGRRAFTEKHIAIFRAVQSAIHEGKMSLESAVASVTERAASGSDVEDTGIMLPISEVKEIVENPRDYALFQALLDRLDHQEKTQREILARLDRQAESQEQRDKALMTTMRELLEQRRIEAGRKKSFFGRIFSK